MKIDLENFAKQMFYAGFAASSQGYNGEHPFDGCESDIARNLVERAGEAFIQALSDIDVEG